MATEILSLAISFLTDHLRGKTNRAEVTHPWRKDWQYTLEHCLRVENLALQILNKGATELTGMEVLDLRLAAILHDIGRLDLDQGHAGLSAQIVSTWLEDQPPVAVRAINPKHVVQLIAGHSDKDISDSDQAAAVLKDADLLDELGILSLFMVSNRADRNSPHFYHQIKDQLVNHELPYCNRQLARLQTQAGRLILLQRMDFLTLCVRQLELELSTASGAIGPEPGTVSLVQGPITVKAGTPGKQA